MNLNEGENGIEEISLLELLLAVWRGRILILVTVAVFSILSVIYAISIPNEFKSTVVLAPRESGGASSLGGLMSQYGGLASMAGISLASSGSSRVDQAVLYVESRTFLEAFIDKYKLEPELLAAIDWDFESDSLIYDDQIYSVDNKSWVSGIPNMSRWNAFNRLRSILGVSRDAKTGMLYLSIEFYSPSLAQQWVTLIKDEINAHYQEVDKYNSRQNILYLQEKIVETNITEVKTALYTMIENELKSQMLADVSKEYLLQTVVPAQVPLVKSFPSRSAICIFFALLGFVLAVVFVVIRYFYLVSRVD